MRTEGLSATDVRNRILALIRVLGLMTSLLLRPAVGLAAPPWEPSPKSASLMKRIPPPDGFERVDVTPGSWSAWLRQLPVVPGRPPVKLHSGVHKANQEAHHVVLDIDVGPRDLQQCADAVMRLFAEYQWSAGYPDAICFRYTSGDRIPWTRWRAGERPQVRKNRVRWKNTEQRNPSYASFRRYLANVFTYAGTASLERDLAPVSEPRRVELGDVFIRGGFPGHAVVVVDVAETPAGARRFLLAQSYMPAQQIHVLRQPGSPSPWYPARNAGVLKTPEWTFRYEDLRRFDDTGCGPRSPLPTPR